MFPTQIRLIIPEKQLYAYLSLVAYVSALIIGTFDTDVLAESGNIVVTYSTIAWIVLGTISFILFFMAYRRSWKFVIWIVGAYLFQVLAIGIYLVSDRPSVFIFLISSFFVFLSFASLFSLIWRVKDLRDRLISVRDLDMEYVPLGLWTVNVVLSGVFLLGSMISFGSWAEGHGNLAFFVVYQALFYLLIIRSFAVPERIASIVPEKGVETKEAQKKSEKVTTIEENRCPLCGSELISERRKCPSCGIVVQFSWCPQSEEYIVNCPYCNQPTPYGRESCIHCGRVLRTSIRCSCGAEHPLSEWIEVK